jgi:hypothetical protein
MFQGKKIISFLSKKIQSPPPPTLVGGSVALQSPRPHGGAIVHDGSSVGAGGLQCFKKKRKKLFLFLFFQETLHSPPPSPDRAVMHDGSSVGAGGLQCFKGK